MGPKILEKKQEVAEYFTRKLLLSKVGKDIERVVLFGSVAKGEVDEYSDVDLLVFGDNTEKIEDAAWEASIDSFAKFEESVEPLVYPIGALRNPNSYFLYNSIRYGKMLYPKV